MENKKNMTDVKNFRLSELEMLFNGTKTENGDDTSISTGNKLLDYLFQAEYYQKHLNEVKIGNSDVEKLFAMFMRDPRIGMKYRDLGRVLERQAGVSAEAAAFAGRFDDLWESSTENDFCDEWLVYLFKEAIKGNELAKKWMPHYVASHKNGTAAKSTIMASKLRKKLHTLLGIKLNKQQYNKLVKGNTVERMLSEKRYDDIEFSKLPSLALLKYWSRFAGTGNNCEKTEMAERFNAYLDSVKKGEAKMNFSTATVYDIYRNANKIDADLAFDQIKKISGNWLPILDSSGSMFDYDDSIGKASSIAHYLAKTSTYAQNKVISFGQNPRLIDITDSSVRNYDAWTPYVNGIDCSKSNYSKEITRMWTGFDGNNTDFGKVMELLSNLKTEFPEYLVVLSDMEFDCSSSETSDKVTQAWKENGINTKLVWWNFNTRHNITPKTVRTDESGNIFISGYDPTILQFMESGFNGETFLDKLLSEYEKQLPQGLKIYSY